MQLIVFRHGIAQDRAADGTDAGRTLTPAGVDKTRTAAVGLATLVQAPGAILTSPKARAKQTAEILGGAFDIAPREEPTLAQESLDPILAVLARRREDAVVIVGHDPTLSRLIARLVAARAADADPDTVELKKAGAASLTVTFDDDRSPHAVLHWLLPAGVLRRLGDGRG